ncbi:J domain-containing protein [Psychrobacter sp. AOP22-C1-22]|uniref:J domain-containing protein n=1 Tax=unclassified Psychrobacter TaxID=196806 RepID=UPI0017888CF0|nr:MULTISPECIES: DnaJ domain-containing protein [unclassified Psychrobacter]MBE0407954.1 DnaJ domain-containing protein [Psychrobacter sp. FME6]MBE0446297.1 DnaJ domain-containing protein [Psychrobacter sp. FME5]
MNSLHTHYDTLMVSRNASPEVIRAAFKSLSQKYHPDRNNHPNADQIMQQFNEAYAALSNPIERSKYDRSLAEYESKLNEESLYDSARKDYGSERQNKVVVINIPDSISLSGTKEKIHDFVSSKPSSATSNSKGLKLFLNFITVIMIIIIIGFFILFAIEIVT